MYLSRKVYETKPEGMLLLKPIFISHVPLSTIMKHPAETASRPGILGNTPTQRGLTGQFTDKAEPPWEDPAEVSQEHMDACL